MTTGRRTFLGGSLAGAIALILGTGATRARGAFCQRPRKRKSHKRFCNGSLKRCGGLCVPQASTCYDGVAYEPCGNSHTFVAATCCNGGGQCQPAEHTC